MATSKSGGTTGNGRDSISKRLGCKCFDGQVVVPGQILIRQRGTRTHPGRGVKRGGDDTLFACVGGCLKYHLGLKGRKFVSVLQVTK